MKYSANALLAAIPGTRNACEVLIKLMAAHDRKALEDHDRLKAMVSFLASREIKSVALL